MWFRFYTEALDDPKVQRLPADQFRVWVNLLCIAKRFDGKLPAKQDCAFMLRMDYDAFHETFEALKSSGLFDEKVGQNKHTEPHNWSKRQYKSDSSTERVKRYRQRSKRVTVTAPEQRTDTDTEKKYKRNKTELEKGFSEWWNLWIIAGTKHAVAKAEEKYLIALSKATQKELCEGLTRYMRHCKASATPVSMICHPTTFLHQGRWSDEYALDDAPDDLPGGGTQFEPSPLDYGMPDGTILVGRAPQTWTWRLPGGETRETAR